MRAQAASEWETREDAPRGQRRWGLGQSRGQSLGTGIRGQAGGLTGPGEEFGFPLRVTGGFRHSHHWGSRGKNRPWGAVLGTTQGSHGDGGGEADGSAS